MYSSFALHIRGNIPLLRKLHRGKVGQTQFFVVVPHLRKVLLTEEGCENTSLDVWVPWNATTPFKAKLPLACHFDLLQFAPNLVEYELELAKKVPQVQMVEISGQPPLYWSNFGGCMFPVA